jgi:hypothetical protein
MHGTPRITGPNLQVQRSFEMCKKLNEAQEPEQQIGSGSSVGSAILSVSCPQVVRFDVSDHASKSPVQILSSHWFGDLDRILFLDGERFQERPVDFRKSQSAERVP